MLQKLHAATNDGDIAQVLRSTPTTLADYYRAAVQGAASRSSRAKRIALNCLGLLSCSERILHESELIHAISLLLNFGDSTSPYQVTLHEVVEACGGLVTQDELSSDFAFIQASSKDFVNEWLSTQSAPLPNFVMVETSFGLLLSKALSNGRCQNLDELTMRLNQYPFLSYAAKFWGYHFRRLDSEATRVKFASTIATLFADQRGQSPLHVAAKQGQAAFISDYFNDGNSNEIDVKDNYGRTALHYAVLERHVNVIRSLLAHRCNPQLVDRHDKTPWQYAIENDDPEAVTELLGALNLQEDKMTSTLNKATMLGQTSLVNVLVVHGARIGDSSLFMAIASRSEAAVEILPTAGANVNQQKPDRSTPLHAAFKSKSLPVAKLLLDSGARVTARDVIGRSPLFYAVEANDVAAVMLNIQYGADVNCVDHEETSLLHVAARLKSFEVAAILLDHGALINARDHRGRSPIFDAVEANDFPLVQLIMKYGSDINCVDHEKASPIHVAARLESYKVMRALLHAGADCNICNNHGRSPLFNAAKAGKVLAVKMLLNSGADLNCVDCQGASPLISAICGGHEDVVKLLLKHSPDPHGLQVKGDKDSSALALASRLYGNGKIVRLLLKFGAETMKDNTLRHVEEDSSQANQALKCFEICHSLHSYTLAWICGVSSGLTAAQACLDEKYSAPNPVSPSDINTYVLGRIACHNIVIAAPSPSLFNTAPVAKAIANLMQTFPGVELGLLVGLGSGVPGPKNEIRLGDVVVGTPGRSYSGVISYDVGVKPCNRQLAERSARPPMVALNAITQLRNQQMLGEMSLQNGLDQIISKTATLRETFQRSHVTPDILPTPDIGDGALILQSKHEDGREPHIHYGLIASGTSVINDAQHRDELAKRSRVLCFEREGVGLTPNFPCVVIRGISDYADGHKTDVSASFRHTFFLISPIAFIIR